MIFKKKRKRLFFLLLFLSILLFLSGTVLSYFNNRVNQPERITKRLSDEISSSELELSTRVGALLYQLNNVPFPRFKVILSERYDDFINSGCIYLVYQKDSLVAWTDNAFQAPGRLDEKILAHPVILRGNGYYLQKSLITKDWSVVGLQLIKYRFKYHNEYLPQGYFKRFNAPVESEISLLPGVHDVVSSDGKFLFSISLDNGVKPGILFMFLVFTLYVSSFLCLVAALFSAYLLLFRVIGSRWLMLSFFILDVIILRAIQFYFQFPSFFYDSDLFSPVYFASSDLLPSLGDLLINTFLVLQLSYYVFKYSHKKSLHVAKNRIIGIGLGVLINLLVLGLFEVFRMLMSGLVINSSIPLKFDRLLSLSALSIAGLVVIVSSLFAFILLAISLSRMSSRLICKKSDTIIALGLVLLLYAGYIYTVESIDLYILVLVSVWLILINLDRRQYSSILKTGMIFIYLLILSIAATYMVNSYSSEKEHEQRKIMATHLSDPRDQQAEYFFRMTKMDISNDKNIINLLSKKTNDSIKEKEAISYVRKNYFGGFWNKYDILITVCHSGKKLSINPENIVTECDSYFAEHIKRDLREIDTTSLYFLDRSIDITYYMGRIPVMITGNGAPRLFTFYLEFSAKNSNRGLGYPELLMDKSLPSSENLPGYSYAFYYQGELVRNVGKYFYDIDNKYFKTRRTDFSFMNRNGYSHLIHSIDDKTNLIVSIEKPGIANLLAPFSFIFFFLVILLFIILLITGNTFTFRSISLTFRLRLQVFIVALILSSSLLIGGITIYYLNQLNYNKNKDIVNEKMNSVLVEMENRFGTSGLLMPSMKQEFNVPLMNLSNSVFTDINVYGLDGFLLASSRSQIFEEGLVAGEMDPVALSMLADDRKSFFIHNERIGNYTFLSAYAPLRNFDNKLIGYLNLPYFARQEDLRQEMSKLIATYANLYIIIIALAVFLALLISRYITRPLQLIRTQLGNLQLGKSNAKVKWNRADEIGDLVAEYNRMIDELALSAEMLARSERESAWREMARQVAHEIKNPLTPIKLSMQHLIKAWDDHAPDWENRLKRFSQTLIMQIDTLSAIATEFSDFAQMPQSNFKNIDIVDVMHHSAQLFKEQENVSIIYPQERGVYYAFADENQMLRVFNNLIKNSIQAIPSEKQGLIRIELEDRDSQCLIVLTDNGSGIPTEQQTSIFSPNFTTKSAGMGLGLAMVKNIIDNSGGRIWFESKEGNGTSFYILLPSNVSN